MSLNGEGSRAIKDVLSAIKVASPQEFVFAGRSFAVHGAGHQHVGHQHAGHQHVGHQHAVHGAPDAQSQAFAATLSAYLYEFAYSRPFRDPLPESEGRELSIDFGLLEALSMANTTRERWEHDWTIAQVLQ